MHQHHHHQDDDSRGLRLAFLLNLGFTLVELVGGILTNSVAILSDAVHDLGDSLSLGLAWLLGEKAKGGPDRRFSYGKRRLSLLATLINALVLVAGTALVLGEAIPRLFAPQMPHATGMLWLAVLGVLVNGAAVLRLRKGKSLNAKVISWHLLEDVLGWLMVLVVALVLHVKEWPILDPLLSVAYSLFILFNVFKVLKATVLLFLQATPADLDLAQVRQALLALEEVVEIHHLHAWSQDGQHHVVTGHRVTATELAPDQYRQLKGRIAEVALALELEHTTFEVEFAGQGCRMEGGRD